MSLAAPPAALPAAGVSAARSGAGLRVLALAFVLRAALFPLAENKQGDAPMRALIAERLNLDATAAPDPRAYCQFGPLHMTLMRPFLALDDELPRSSRYLSLLAGLLTFLPFRRLAARLVGAPAAALATLGLAVSPMHLQASTTAASEALYLLLFVLMLERLTAALADERAPPGVFVLAGLLASLAAVTRYDAWIAVPAATLTAWVFARGPAGPARAARARGLVLFAFAAAVLPAGWVAWSAARTDDPLFFFHYITADHAQLAASALARFGAALGRVRQVGIWSLALVATMTLPLVIALGVALGAGVRARRPGTPLSRVVLVAALTPLVVYLGQGLLRLGFEPLPRFALVPGALLLPFAAAAVSPARRRAAAIAVPLSALAFSVGLLVIATTGRDRIWGGAEAMGALTRLDAEDRALADYLRAHRAPGERVMIEPFAYAEIAVTAEARVPATEATTLALTREPRATLAETRRATGAAWIAARADAPAGWVRRLPDWPPTAVELGRWRLVGP